MRSSIINLKNIFFSVSSWKIKFIKIIDYVLGSFIAYILPPKKIFTQEIVAPKNILLIRPGGIGDAIFLLPLLRKIHQEHPTIKIDVLCEKRNIQIFCSQKNICHQIFDYTSLKSLLKLFKNKYDVIIDSEQWHYLSAIIGYVFNSTQTIGFATRPLRKKLFSSPTKYQIGAYELSNFQKLFDPILKNIDPIENINSCYTVPNKLINWTKDEFQNKYITLYLGASIPLRRFTKKQCLAIIQSIFQKNYSTILIGGRDVFTLGKSIEDQVNNRKLINMIGQTSLEQTAAIIKESKLFIGTDSGIMHLACAVGSPVIALFGPGNLEKWEPKGNMNSIISEDLICSPCTQFGYTVPTCHGKYQCMKNIKIETICKKIQLLQ